MTKLSLSPSEARQLALHGHCLQGKERGVDGAERVIQQIGYLQIDAISVIMRAHHHTLWNRVHHYKPEMLDQLLSEHRVFEYWAHAAAFLPMADFRFSLPAKNALKTGQRQHWFRKDEKVMQDVLAKIRAEGPLSTADFADPEHRRGTWWSWKPAKRALEQLFMQGDLFCVSRRGFKKVYDLTERALPDWVDTREPSALEFCHHLLERSLNLHGFVRPQEVAYLRKGLLPQVKTLTQQLLEQGELMTIECQGERYLTTERHLNALNTRQQRRTLRFLSPFDSAVIQRKRLKQLFDFDYQIECYVPAAKRQYGYFVLPILWGTELVARIDLKADRPAHTLKVLNFVSEDRFSPTESFFHQLSKTLKQFAKAHDCQRIHTNPTLNLAI